MNGENWVVKSNALIESKGRLSSLERKIILGLISEISSDDNDFKEYSLYIEEYKRNIGTSAKNFYIEMKKACESLVSRSITIETILEDGNREKKAKRKFTVMSYLSSAEYIDGQNTINVTFDPKLKPYLLDLKGHFTKYQLKNILSLKGTHAIKIYELLKQYENTNSKKRSFKIDELKSYLGIQNKYKAFKDFEKYVLMPSKNEINSETDLMISYVKIKEGRSVSEIEFSMERIYDNRTLENRNIEIIVPEVIIKVREVCNQLKLDPVQSEEIYTIACKMTDPLLLDPYEYIRINYEAISDREDIKNKVAYLKKILEIDGARARATMMGL